MSSSRGAAAAPPEPLLRAPFRDREAFIDRLVLALALAPRPISGRDAVSPLAPAWRRVGRGARPRRG